MKIALLLSITLFFFGFGLSQPNQDACYKRVLSDMFSDTIFLKGPDYTLMHFHIISDDIEKKILHDRKDSVFSDEFNRFSRLVFHSLTHSFDVPTIPLTNIIYLKEKGIIIGFSKITISPFQVVIYSEDGELVFKRALGPFVVILSKSQMSDLAKNFPILLSCMLQMPIIKKDNTYQLEISPCLLNAIGPDSLIKRYGIKASPYFPLMSHPTDQPNYSSDRYYNFFSDSDPLYDLIMIGSIPYLLILNSEAGEKINIPLVPNCNILKELQDGSMGKVPD